MVDADAVRQAVIVSNARQAISRGMEKVLSLAEAFYMATLGGARVCGLEGKVGSFEVGKEFDALWVSMKPGVGGGIATMLEAGFFTVDGEQVGAADWVSDSLGLRIQLGVLPEDFWTNPHLDRQTGV